MIMAFNSDAERDEQIRLFEEATKQELKSTKEEIETLNRIADELEMAVAEMVQERVKANGRAA